MFSTRVELDNFKTMHTRYTTSLWELGAMAGGFSVFAIFVFEFIYKFAKSNSVYVLNQAYLKSQY